MEIKIYVANLGAYNRGTLHGKWLDLPLTDEEMDKAMTEILNAPDQDPDYPDEEVDIHDYEASFDVTRYSVIHLNELADQINNMEDNEQELVEAIMESGLESSLEDAIENKDKYGIISDCKDESDLGYYWLFDSGCYEIPEEWASYIDYEAWGRDLNINQSGYFISGDRYIYMM